MSHVIGCRPWAIVAVALLPGLALGQKAPVSSTQNVNVVNTSSSPVQVAAPGGVMVSNPVGMPVPITGSVSVSIPSAGSWPVEVVNSPSVQISNQPTVQVAGSVPVTGSVALTGTPGVNVTNTNFNPVPVSGSVTVTASSALPVTLASAAVRRYSIAFSCYSQSECDQGPSVSIPVGKVFVLEFVSGSMATPGTTSAGYVQVLTHAVAEVVPGAYVACLALPSRTQDLGTQTYSFFSAVTACNLRGLLYFFAANTESGGASNASILLSGYLTDE